MNWNEVAVPARDATGQASERASRRTKPSFARLLYPASVLLVLAWLAYWLVVTRYALLDDALIHLQYARMLDAHHFITFDGIQHGFGASSLLYVSLLAFLQKFFDSPLLPKAVSDIAYLALLATIGGLIYKFRRSALSQIFLAELALCLMSPMGIRWSTDGMETSLTNLSVIVLAMIVKREQEEQSVSGMRALLLVIFGAGLVYLRIELALIVALACASILVARLSGGRRWLQSILSACPLGLGAAAALISIRIIMGHFLPDTALAKSGDEFSTGPLIASAKVMGGALIAGIGLGLCWFLSLCLTLRRIARDKSRFRGRLLLVLIENSAFVLIIALACLRSQAVQGVRYLMWPLIFALICNASLAHSVRMENRERTDSMEFRATMVFLAVALCLLPVDWRLAAHAMRGRSQTFLEMRASHLDRWFQGKPIVAADVGFITYFSRGRTCDLDGLVDGRAMAAMSFRQRAAHCAKQSPSMLFLTLDQAQGMSSVLDLNEWRVCGFYDFTNAMGTDRHYLMVPAASADRVCHTLDISPSPGLPQQSGS